MHKKVYIVTSGEYSCYRIEAVFSSKKLAKDYIKLKSRIGYWYYRIPRIEEYVLNELPKYPPDKNHYMVSLELNTGNLIGIDFDSENSDKDLVFKFINSFTETEKLWVYCWAKDEEHAKKIAYDVRTKLLVERIIP